MAPSDQREERGSLTGEALLIPKLNMIATQINHEDDLISARVSWLVMSQSSLFGTYVAVVGVTHVVGREATAIHLLLDVIPVVGMLLPVLLLIAVGAAIYAMAQWRAERRRILSMTEAQNLD